MKQHIFVIAFFCALIFAGCERERNYERTIWVNPDVECCGVKDPLNNLEWLRQTAYFNDYETASYSFSNYILLLKNNTTHENFIVTNTDNGTNWIIIYDCDGNMIGGGQYFYNYKNSNKINQVEKAYKLRQNDPAQPCEICDEFFKTHTLTDTIAYFIVEPKI